MKNRKKIQKKTERLFSKIHTKQMNKNIFFRLSNLLNHNFLGLNKNFFKSKYCLDAASGLNANATVNMLNMGAKHVCLFDMNKKILTLTKKFLSSKFSKSKFSIKKSNLLKIGYPDNHFDFVHCAGAIHHTVNIKKSISELCRVTKKGGTLYLEYYGYGGIARKIVDLLRTTYKKDIQFKRFIDQLDINTFKKIKNFIKSENLKFKINKFSKKEYNSFEKYLDYDLILTIQDRIKSPMYTQIKYSEVKKILKSKGFIKIKRVSKFPIFENIRKYLSPFYRNHNNYYSKILYGEGMPQILAEKNK